MVTASGPSPAGACRLFRQLDERRDDRLLTPSQPQPAADAPRPGPSTRLRIAFVQLPLRYTFRRCLYLACERPRSRLEHLASTCEIPSSGRIQQNPSVYNRRYKRRCSTCLDVLFLPHLFLGDRVSVYRRAKLGLDFVFVKTAR